MKPEEAILILNISLDCDKGKSKMFMIPMQQYITAQEMAIEALKRPHGEWIPCSERLPEEHGYYIVQTDGSRNAVIDIAEYGIFIRKPDYKSVWGWNKASKVIAWMPLPEPYKKEGEAE